MKILVSGGNGVLAKTLVKSNTIHDIKALSRIQMDVRDTNSIIQSLAVNNPDIFIHAGALTRPMKKHVNDPYDSISCNILGTANVALCSLLYNKYHNKNIKLIYISTDYVYPGKSGNYSEEDGLSPVNNYAWSKLGGECSIKLYPNHLILRCSIVEDPFPHKKAFTDSYKSCISHKNVCKIIFKLIESNAVGTINVGEKRQSIFNYVRNNNNSSVAPGSIYDINEPVAIDSSTNIKRLEKWMK